MGRIRQRPLKRGPIAFANFVMLSLGARSA